MIEIARARGLPAAAATDERQYYSVTQAAARLGVSRVTVWRWVRDGRLPVARLGHRTVRIAHADLQHLLDEAGAGATRSWVARGRPAGADGVRAAADGSAGSDEHFVQFYEADDFLLDAVAEYIGAALRAGEAGMVIATEPHRRGIERRLRAAGLDLDAAAAGGAYAALDAAGTLARFLVNGAPDADRFAAVIGDVLDAAAAGGRRVRAFGEMVALLACDGRPDAVVRLERLWNDLRATRPFSLYCAYPMECLGDEALVDLLDDVCGEHGRVVPAESYATLPSGDDRQRAVAMLQQKARRLEAALASERAAREAAEAALRTRDEFLSIAAHELRTPLTSLSGQAQLALRLLQRGGLQPEQAASSLRAITGQAEKLGRLLAQLLDISRLEAGKLTLDRQAVDLAALVEQVAADARTWSSRHQIALDAPPALVAEIDPLRLEQVLVNLLDNAIKYSPDGGAIDIALRPHGGGVEIAVRDHGLGIPPERRGRIFERFYQAHGDVHRSGLGLGLHISRQIVELHGGEIRAEFPEDGGTRVVVVLPSIEAAAA